MCKVQLFELKKNISCFDMQGNKMHSLIATRDFIAQGGKRQNQYATTYNFIEKHEMRRGDTSRELMRESGYDNES